jgi:hypothetical protein
MIPEPLGATHDPPSTSDAAVPDGGGVPRPRLWKQLIGLCVTGVAVLLFYGPAGILIVAAGAVVFADAWIAGIFKRPGGSGLLNNSPMVWGIATMGLLVVAYPLYAFNRNRLRTRPGKSGLFIAVNVLGGLSCLLAVLQLTIRVMHR